MFRRTQLPRASGFPLAAASLLVTPPLRLKALAYVLVALRVPLPFLLGARDNSAMNSACGRSAWTLARRQGVLHF